MFYHFENIFLVPGKSKMTWPHGQRKWKLFKLLSSKVSLTQAFAFSQPVHFFQWKKYNFIDSRCVTKTQQLWLSTMALACARLDLPEMMPQELFFHQLLAAHVTRFINLQSFSNMKERLGWGCQSMRALIVTFWKTYGLSFSNWESPGHLIFKKNSNLL